MPLKSKAQQAFLRANKPDLAKEFQAATPNDAALPDRASNPAKTDKPRSRGMRKTQTRDFDKGMLSSSDAHKIKM